MKYDKWIGGLLLGISVILTAVSVCMCFGSDIWYDELFTMGFTGHSVSELIALTARDVHPPFYYLYVKGVQELCKLILPAADLVMLSKICSVLPFILLLCYAAAKVRKNFGILCAGIFSFCVLAMPQLSQYTTEVRMYSLALFLVTAAFLHAYDIVRESKAKDWILVTVYGILAAYTHYFAAVAAAMIYLYLLFRFLIQEKRRKELKKWGLCVCISILSYLPWMFAVVSQVKQVKENYWILPLTLRSLGGCVKFLLKPAFSNGAVNVAAAILLFVIYAAAALNMIWKKEEKEETGFAAAGLVVLGGLVIFGFLASFLLRPVFIYRYMIPAAGCFWLSFSILVSRLKNQKLLLLPILILTVTIGITDFKGFVREESWKKEQMELTGQELSRIGSEDAVIFNFNQVQAVLGYYLENETYLWMQEPETLIAQMFDGKYAVMDSGRIKEWLAEDRRVWFVGSGNAREDLMTQWQADGILTSEQASCLLERYWFNIYSVELEK